MLCEIYLHMDMSGARGYTEKASNWTNYMSPGCPFRGYYLNH
jgi:hypothetical protein